VPRIEQELAGPATQDAPTCWLKALLSRHDTEAQSAPAYLQQSLYYFLNHWDLPKVDNEDGDSGDSTDDDDEDVDPWAEVGDDDEYYDEDGMILDKNGEDSCKVWNDQIQHRFMGIINDIVHYFGLGVSRMAFATGAAKDEWDDIFLEYDGPLANPHIFLRAQTSSSLVKTRNISRGRLQYTQAQWSLRRSVSATFTGDVL